MDAAYLNAIATYGAGLITHLGLVDESGAELSGGGYARQAVSWTAASDGLIRPTSDKNFSIPAGATVRGWRGFSASTGGTNYGGASVASTYFVAAGSYLLLAVATGIEHD